MSWNIGDTRNLFLKLKSKLRLYHVLFATTKTPPEKLTLTAVEKQHFLYNKEEISCLNWTIYNCRRNVFVNFNTDTDKMNNVVNGYRKNFKSETMKLT